MPNNQFTWIPLYKELAEKLLDWDNRQGELIALIEAMRADDLIVTTMADRDANDNPFLMKEIDPFTFFGVFNRSIKNEGRIFVEKLALILLNPDGGPRNKARPSHLVAVQIDQLQTSTIKILW